MRAVHSAGKGQRALVLRSSSAPHSVLRAPSNANNTLHLHISMWFVRAVDLWEREAAAAHAAPPRAQINTQPRFSHC